MKKPTKELQRWSVFITSKKAAWIGSVEAKDEKEAMAKALKDLDVRSRRSFPS
jgi:hypothetical protein